ncbi:MAG: hypothetical protein VYC62_00520 [Verrucomicrobiota bacterium]|nr:hypothetical protein [Verrucomicrobiota bacterium]
MSGKKTVNIWSITGINLLAWPGLGTLLAGRKISGFIQAAMSLVGAVLTICLLFVLFKFASIGIESSEPIDSQLFIEENRSLIIYGIVGVGMLTFAWFWAAISTYSIAKQLHSETKP